MNRPADPRESGSSRASAAACLGLSIACLVALGLACFRGVLFDGRQFGLRDAAHFYYPLYQRVQQEWEAGRWPLWEPEENAGMPLLGNPTAAVFYPGKLVFFALAYPWAMRSFVIAHVVLAFVSMRAMLRGWQVSPTGSTIGAIAYAFGAPVLSQTCNATFLVGAAWAPFGFLAADRWLRLRRRGALTGLAVVLAMQVLGGDPQAAYLTVLCASAYAAVLAVARVPSEAARLSRRLVVGLVIAYAIGLDEAEVKALQLGVVIKKAEHIAAFFEPVSTTSPLAGVGPADVHNRDPQQIPLVSGGATVVGDGVLAQANDAGVVFCQLVPWRFDYSKERHNVKQTFRRSTFLVTRLLGNLGVEGSTPVLARFSSPVDPAKAEKRWLDGLYLDQPEEWDDPYRFFRW